MMVLVILFTPSSLLPYSSYLFFIIRSSVSGVFHVIMFSFFLHLIFLFPVVSHQLLFVFVFLNFYLLMSL